MLILVLAGVALSPFWAPAITPLLPWGESIPSAREDYAALEARLEAVEKRPASPGLDLDAFKSAQSTLSRRLDQLEAAHGPDQQTEAAVATTKSGLQQLDRRVGALEQQSSSRGASDSAALREMQQELTRLDSVSADFANRLSTLERRVQSQTGAERTDATLALLLSQFREAVEQARPFPAEYNTFRALAREHPDLVAAAEPLAGAAQNGVASRPVLSKRLADLAGELGTASEPPAESDWGAQALARLRGLVTIRRIDDAPRTGPEAAVNAAQSALSRGDLDGAVMALDTLSGAAAEAVRPWLRMAQERLAVEKALEHLQQMLAARLDSPASGPAPAPAGVPAEPPAKPKAPS